MKKQTMRIFAIIMMILVVFPLQMFAMAAQKDEVEPLWDNAMSVTLSIGSGKVQSRIVGVSGVSQILLDVYVYVQNGSSWDYVTENHKTASSMMLTDTFNFTAAAGAYYRADFTVVIIKNGVSEVITQTKYYNN